MYFYYTRRCIMTTNILLYKMMYNDNKHFVIHEDVFLLYKTMYNDNKYFIIHESVFLLYMTLYFLLYKLYNKIFYYTVYITKKYFYYTWRCISCYTRICIIKYLLSLYKLYNDNKYFLYETMRFYYTRWCIIKYLLSVYKRVYNDNKYFIIQYDV